MLESLISFSGWGLMIIIGPLLLGLALVYGVVRAGRKRDLSPAANAARDQATKDLYQSDHPETVGRDKDTFSTARPADRP